eukprot:226960_1
MKSFRIMVVFLMVGWVSKSLQYVIINSNQTSGNRCVPINVVNPSSQWMSWDSNEKLCDIWFGSECIIDCTPLGKGSFYDGLKTRAVCKYNNEAGGYFWLVYRLNQDKDGNLRAKRIARSCRHEGFTSEGS